MVRFVIYEKFLYVVDEELEVVLISVELEELVPTSVDEDEDEDVELELEELESILDEEEEELLV